MLIFNIIRTCLKFLSTLDDNTISLFRILFKSRDIYLINIFNILISIKMLTVAYPIILIIEFISKFLMKRGKNLKNNCNFHNFRYNFYTTVCITRLVIIFTDFHRKLDKFII